jgi:hypothetical protein
VGCGKGWRTWQQCCRRQLARPCQRGLLCPLTREGFSPLATPPLLVASPPHVGVVRVAARRIRAAFTAHNRSGRGGAVRRGHAVLRRLGGPHRCTRRPLPTRRPRGTVCWAAPLPRSTFFTGVQRPAKPSSSWATATGLSVIPHHPQTSHLSSSAKKEGRVNLGAVESSQISIGSCVPHTC